ncbi:MAG: TlyA family RNA methyltransferase [Hyphomicrobium sp.]
MRQVRLDARLVADGLTTTRARARDVIVRGFVSVGGSVCTKPGREVSNDAAVALAADAPRHVSRGAEKLEAALAHFKFPCAGAVALDIGASTGGFTEVLLEAGAARVFAVDVGHDQLSAKLRANPRVTVCEGTDARALDAALIDDPVTALVADVSFISLTKALPAALDLVVPGGWMIALIKPQFELTPRDIGKGGIVRDAMVRQRAVDTVRTWLESVGGWRVAGVIASPILGGSGNEEFLIGAVRCG